MSRTRLQDEYNAAIREADIFVLLVHTKVGKYSREEFETALAQFHATGRPRIYTYFKNTPEPGEPDPGPGYASVRELRRRVQELGHFETRYEHAAELLDHLNQQLDKLSDKGFIVAAPAAGTAAAVGANLQASVQGSGAAAVGAGAQAVGERGVGILGTNSGDIDTGTQNHIHTGGGAYVGGNVSVSNGDFTGRDRIEYQVAGRDRQDLDLVFARLRSELEAMARQADRPLVAEVAQALQEEAAQAPAQRSDGRMARLLDGLADLVPTGVAAIVAAFATPLLGAMAGPLTAAVLSRFEKKR